MHMYMMVNIMQLVLLKKKKKLIKVQILLFVFFIGYYNKSI